MNKKRIALIALALLVFAGILWFGTHRQQKIVVHGTLSAKDFAEIKRVIRSERLREIFPEFSWSVLERLPNSLSTYFQCQVLEFDVRPNNTVVVGIGLVRPAGQLSTLIDRDYVVSKRTNGWILETGIPVRDPLITAPNQ